ncbi:MAG: hypothetical protein CL963_00080 [Euryarchaeota archaeon]|nr:hypothetical protein [Euryarchaeota archaeon]
MGRKYSKEKNWKKYTKKRAGVNTFSDKISFNLKPFKYTHGRVAELPLLCALGLIFVLFQPAFGSYIGDYSSGADGGTHIAAIKNGFQNWENIDWSGTDEIGMSNGLTLVMLIVLLLAILLFSLTAFGFTPVQWGTYAAVLSFVYAGINYILITQANQTLGWFSFMGGLSFGISGIVAIIVGVIYFYKRQ